MKDSYVGDINDFVKYGLLRTLCGMNASNEKPFRLGVSWYLFPDQESNNDGQLKPHFHPDKSVSYQSYDPELHAELKRIVDNGIRKVSSIRESAIFPKGTLFYEAPLTFSAMPTGDSQSINKRLAHRQEWLEGGYELLKDCDLVFLDPDNGLEVKSVKQHNNFGPKFVFFDELLPYIRRGQSLIIYQHKSRSGTVQEQINARLEQFDELLGFKGKVFPLYFKVSRGLIFFILPAAQHEEVIRQRLKEFQASQWGKYVQK